MRYLITLLLLVLVFEFAKCQKIQGYKYHAIYIPAEITDNINIDGDLSEWNWVPQEYKLHNPDLINSEQVTTDDFEVEFFVSWSKITNKLYIIAKVIDDIVNSDKLNEDDGLDIIVNPNKISGDFWSGSNYKFLFSNIIYFVLAPNTNLNEISITYGPHWIINKDYLNYATKTKKLSDGKSISYYEAEFCIWEDLSLYSRTLSKPYKLKSGQEIGLTIMLNDVDLDKYLRDIQLRTFSGNSYRFRAEDGSNFILDPPNSYTNFYDELMLLISH